MPDTNLILGTGATDYVGGRLIPRLLVEGCLARDLTRLQERSWINQVELVQGGMQNPASLSAAMRDVQVVY